MCVCVRIEWGCLAAVIYIDTIREVEEDEGVKNKNKIIDWTTKISQFTLHRCL